MSRLSMQEKLSDAVARNNISLVDEILTAHSWLSQRCVRGQQYRGQHYYNSNWPIMHGAAMHGQPEMIRVLAKHGFPVNEIEHYDSPMDLAVLNNEVGVVKQLITLGVEVDETIEKRSREVPFDYPFVLMTGRNYYARESQLKYAIRMGYKDIVKCICAMFRKTTHRNLVGICLALAPLCLPAYVILWIIDWLPEYTCKSEIRKIRLIQCVAESVRRRVALRRAAKD